MANPFVHVELNTTDVTKAKNFYGKLFGWKLEDVEMDGGAYTMIKVGEGTGGGIIKHPVPGAPSAWLAYVQVDDIGAATQLFGGFSDSISFDGRGKGNERSKRAGKMYVDLQHFATVSLPHESAVVYPDGTSPGKTMENSGK